MMETKQAHMLAGEFLYNSLVQLELLNAWSHFGQGVTVFWIVVDYMPSPCVKDVSE